MRNTVLATIALVLAFDCTAQSAPAGATRDLSAYKSKVVTQAPIGPLDNAPTLIKPANCSTTACLTKRVSDLEALVAAQHEKILLLEAALKEKGASK